MTTIQTPREKILQQLREIADLAQQAQARIESANLGEDECLELSDMLDPVLDQWTRILGMLPDGT